MWMDRWLVGYMVRWLIVWMGEMAGWVYAGCFSVGYLVGQMVLRFAE